MKHISQDVAQEFAHRSYQLQHIFVHSILKENARKGLVVGFLQHDSRVRRDVTESSEGEMIEIHSGQAGATVEQDSVPRDWYPFDPYALPRSKGFVVDCFLEYRPLEADDDDEDEDMDTDEDDSDEMDGDSEEDDSDED